MILSGKVIAEKIYHKLQERVEKLQQKNITPHLVVFLIGENPASVAYVRQKQTKGEEIGCKVTIVRLETSITTDELEEKVKTLNDDPSVHGILIQRPVPEHVDIDKLELLTNPEKDIDGFHPESPYTLPLPLAVVEILSEIHPNQTHEEFIHWLQSRNIIITGKGPTGGGPIIRYLKKLNVPATIIDSKTPNPKELLKQADVVIAAVGKEKMIKSEDLKQGVILVGVGILRGADGKLHGDYDEADIEGVASYYTPTPGGVGPVNVAMLFENVLTAAEKLSN